MKTPVDGKKRRKTPVEEEQTRSNPWLRWKKGRRIYATREEAKLAYKKSCETDPFNPRGYSYRGRAMSEFICSDRFPCPLLVFLYARMGIHRHNFLKGTNYELNRIMKYNKTSGPPAAASYYITCDAQDPAASSSLTFLASVDEESYGRLSLSSDYARPGGTKDKRPQISALFLPDSLPECPPHNPFRDTNLLQLKQSEWQDTAWIRLYLELAVATTHRGTTHDQDLSTLKIVKVAMDTTDDESGDGLNAKNAAFYIRYKDFCEARVGKDVDRIAIIKRAFNAYTGCFSLVGQNHS